jgi:hypothetical protein
MTDRAAQFEGNLLSAFVMVIGDTLSITVPLTLVIIWICA